MARMRKRILVILVTVSLVLVIYYPTAIQYRKVPSIETRCSNRARLDYTRAKCDKVYHDQPRWSRPSDYSHLLADDKHGVIYCYIPKVASTAWKRAMKLQLSDKREIKATLTTRTGLLTSKVSLKKHKLIQMDQLSMEQIQQKLRTHYKFMISRHPFQRLYSAYYDKFVVNFRMFGSRWYGDIIQQVLGSQRGINSVSFGEFIKLILEGGEWFRRDEHWNTQVKLCHPCVIGYDYLAKYETMTEDKYHLLKMLNASGSDLDSVNVAASRNTSHRYTKKSQMKDFAELTPEQIDGIQKLYQEDFNVFGYDWRGSASSFDVIEDGNTC